MVVENFRPGVMARLGLDHAALAAANPGLVYCTVTGFGSGQGAEMPGYDLLVQAVGGLMSITGSPDGEPQKVGVALVDVITGLFATAGILTALRHRDRTGQGQLVELDLLSCLLAALVNQSTAQTAAGVTAGRMGNAHPSIAPYETFATADGTLVVAVGTDHQFALLCEQIGLGELAGDPRFATNTARVANRVELRAAIADRLLTAPAGEWGPKLRGGRRARGPGQRHRRRAPAGRATGPSPHRHAPGPRRRRRDAAGQPDRDCRPPRRATRPGRPLWAMSADEALALVRRREG